MKKKNSFKVIDLFAGAGGFGLGFHLAEYDIVCSIEKDQWAVDTLKKNSAITKNVILGDITKYKTKKKIVSLCGVKPNVIIGGPPCQGFSVASSDRRDANDPRNLLFTHFIKWVEYLQPEVFVMENVKGILSWKNDRGEKTKDLIVDAFRALGYHVDIWTLNAAEYGVPQIRERVFFVGNKYNKKINPPSPTHQINKQHHGAKTKLRKPVTVWDAISDLAAIGAGEGEEITHYTKPSENEYQKRLRSADGKLYNHVGMKHTKRIVERFTKILEGFSLSDVSDELKVRERNGNGKESTIEYNSNYRRLKKDSISYTIPAHFYSSFIHPTQPRNITAREAARLQSFPDWYKFEGKRTVISSKLLTKLGKHEDNYLSQYNQIGNAVPPFLAQAIAKKIRLFLLRNSQIQVKKKK